MKIVSFFLAAAAFMLMTTPSLAQDETMSRAECSAMGQVVGDPGDGSVSQNPNYICEDGQPPIAIVVPAADEPIASEGEVCCGMEGADPMISEPMDLPDDIPEDEWQTVEYTRQECETLSGTVVGDIGDGSTRNPDYVCDNTLPPIGVIVPAEGEAIAIEGEICCGPPIMVLTSHNDADSPIGNDTSTTNPNQSVMTEEECLAAGGEMVGDIGDGAIFQEDYMCNSNNQSPVGVVVSAEGQMTATGRASISTTMAVEGSVCCGKSSSSDMTNTGNMVENSSSSQISLVGAVAVSALALLSL